MIVGLHKIHINKINFKIKFATIVLTIRSKRNILIAEENYKYLAIYFIRYIHNKSVKILRLHYDKLIGKIEEHEGKKIDGW